MEDTITFGQWVQQRRKTLGLTQLELGSLISCSAVMVRKIESDQRHPSIRITRLLARHLKITPQERAAFMSMAHPDLPPEKLEEIASPYIQPPTDPVKKQVTNLQTPLTPLVGRAQEVAEISALLMQPDVRMVTLTGAGGIGKTRLSIQVATTLKEQFTYGSWFVSLAAVQDPELVVPTIARSLGIKESREWALNEALLKYLADKDMLLVIDNFEQIISAAMRMEEILACAPGLKLLVTSRTVLHLLGEYEFVVPPLKFVDMRNAPHDQEVHDSPAVTLFMQRAQAGRLDFVLTPANAPIIAKICSNLNGVPLAIELAASRIKFLSPVALLNRLEGSKPENTILDELVGGARNLPVRQQTMRSTIDWSYKLLNKNEQDLFRQLSVFVGGYTLEAAAAVCGDVKTDPVALPLPENLVQAFANRLLSLMDQSLLLRLKTTDEEPRFGMLEVLREYALEQLTAHPKEWAAVKRRHVQYFVALAETAEPRLASPDQEIWLDRFEMEHDNLLAALGWCYTAAEEDAQLGLKLMAAGWQFWLIRGYVNEGRLWLQRLLEKATAAPKLDRARALNGAGFLSWIWGDFSQAKALLNESLQIFRDQQDKHGIASVLNHLADVALAEKEFELAYTLVMESLGLFRELKDDSNIAWDLFNLGDIVQAQGDKTQQAGRYFAESQALFQKAGNQNGMAWAQDRLGQQAAVHQDYPEAIRLYTESINLFRKMGDKRSTAWVLNHLGKVALALDDFEHAQQILEESLTLFKEISWLLEGAWATLDMGEAALKLGSTDRAEIFFRKSLRLFQQVGHERGTNEAQMRLEKLGKE